MRKAKVFMNNSFAGILTEKKEGGYSFHYDDDYCKDKSKPSISLTLLKNKQTYESPILFPFFYNMLSEGANRDYQASLYKADEKDYFKLLVETAATDNIGAITFEWIKE